MSENFNEENVSMNEDWYAGQGQQPQKRNKGLFIAIICFAIILSMVAGYVLCIIFGGSVKYKTKYITETQQLDYGAEDTQLAILQDVLDYIRNNYYQELTNEEWEEVISNGATGLLQGAGDNYGYLLTPQEAYNMYNPVSQISSGKTYFGVTYSFVSGVGLKVSSISTDGSCYGIIEEDDIIIKLLDVKDADGNDIVYNGKTYDEITVGDYTSTEIQEMLLLADSVRFVLIRDGELVTLENPIVRGKVGLNKDKESNNGKPDYEYIEFYFSDDYNNISTEVQYNGTNCTYNLRLLENIKNNPEIAYIRLKEFDSNDAVSTATELGEVLGNMKAYGKTKLILDLKGNPGGEVSVASNVAGMLCSPNLLSESDRSKLVTTYYNGEEVSSERILITTLKTRTVDSIYTATSSYAEYFDEPVAGEKCDIVIWTDGSSASASELITGAMIDYGTGFQIGTTTYGKGIAQTITSLPYVGYYTDNYGVKRLGNWYIYYTCAKYYTPLGTNIHGVGYTPDEGYNNAKTYSELWDCTKAYWEIGD